MNTRIKTYIIILAIAYIGIIAYTLYDSSKEFVLGFNDGVESKTLGKQRDTRFLFIDVKPIGDYYSFPNQENNLRSGKPVKTEISSMNFSLENETIDTPVYLNILQGVLYFVALIIIIGLIYIPFAYFSIIKSITRGQLMDKRVVRKSSKIGWILIMYSFLEVAIKLVETQIARTQIQLKDYEIVYHFGFSYYALFILGLIILILSEILRESLKLKEEQELTI